MIGGSVCGGNLIGKWDKCTKLGINDNIVRRDDENKIVMIMVLIRNAYEKGNKKWKRNKNKLTTKGKAV